MRQQLNAEKKPASAVQRTEQDYHHDRSDAAESQCPERREIIPV
jgi:hypothetical protein